MLTRRAINAEVGQKLVDKIRWWKEYVVHQGLEINNNPSPGNKVGGLTSHLKAKLRMLARPNFCPGIWAASCERLREKGKGLG
jgi:altronate hydrolase